MKPTSDRLSKIDAKAKIVKNVTAQHTVSGAEIQYYLNQVVVLTKRSSELQHELREEKRRRVETEEVLEEVLANNASNNTGNDDSAGTASAVSP